MSSPYPLTATEVELAHKFIEDAQEGLSIAIVSLRAYYAATKDENAFRIIHALEARHSRTGTCLDVAFNLDDLRNSLRIEEESANAGPA